MRCWCLIWRTPAGLIGERSVFCLYVFSWFASIVFCITPHFAAHLMIIFYVLQHICLFVFCFCFLACTTICFLYHVKTCVWQCIVLMPTAWSYRVWPLSATTLISIQEPLLKYATKTCTVSNLKRPSRRSTYRGFQSPRVKDPPTCRGLTRSWPRNTIRCSIYANCARYRSSQKAEKLSTLFVKKNN